MTRRSFIASPTLLSAAAGSKNAPITRVDVFLANYPVAGYFKFFSGGKRHTVFVRITLEDGREGWGQSVPIPTWSYETPESVSITITRYLRPVLVGRDPVDIEGAHRAMNRAIAPSFSTGMPIAKAGIDLALHDLAGKLAGKSLHELWGRKPLSEVVLSWTVNTTELADVERLVAEGRARGYRHVNIKVAPDPKFDVQMAKIVRKHMPDESFLWADANGGYDTATALEAAPKLRDAGVDVLEQPVAHNRLSGFLALKKQGALPVILDENVVSSLDLEEFLKLGILDGVAMKPARTAGLFEARKQVEMLEVRKLMFLGS
ncbi:MAG TPA: enolase C-terminal domain-like protein, partial [Bryobacteraceae bacterium]|nr:enolase C-terminal domain-like protein [Bryobacteraceae bacterium]